MLMLAAAACSALTLVACESKADKQAEAQADSL